MNISITVIKCGLYKFVFIRKFVNNKSRYRNKNIQNSRINFKIVVELYSRLLAGPNLTQIHTNNDDELKGYPIESYYSLILNFACSQCSLTQFYCPKCIWCVLADWFCCKNVDWNTFRQREDLIFIYKIEFSDHNWIECFWVTFLFLSKLQLCINYRHGSSFSVE